VVATHVLDGARRLRGVIRPAGAPGFLAEWVERFTVTAVRRLLLFLAALLLLTAASPTGASATEGEELMPAPPQPLEVRIENPEGTYRVEIFDASGARVMPARPPHRSGGAVVVPLPILPPGKFTVSVLTDRGPYTDVRSAAVWGTFGLLDSAGVAVMETGTGRTQDLQLSVRRVPATVPVLLLGLALSAVALIGPGKTGRNRLLVIPALVFGAVTYTLRPSLAMAFLAFVAATAVGVGAFSSSPRPRRWWVTTGVAAGGGVALSLAPLLLVAVLAAAGGLLITRPAPRMLLALTAGTAALIPLTLSASIPTPSQAAPDPQSCYELDVLAAFGCLDRALKPRLADPSNLETVIDEVQRAELAGLFDRAESAFSCHGLAHNLGRAMARYQDPAAYATVAGTACLSGYIHGMVEEAALMFDTEPFTRFLIDTCGALPPDEADQCVHGSGHAAFERTGGDLPAALDICAALDGSSSCVDGAVMSFVEQYVTARRDRGWQFTIRPTPEVSDAYLVCGEITQQWVDICLRWAMRQYPSGDPDTLANALTAGAWCISKFPGRPACAWGAAVAVVPTAQPPTPGHGQQACDALGALSEVCMVEFIERATDNMILVGRYGELAELQAAVCAGLRDRQGCEQRAEARAMINPFYRARQG
jgi:hypothetical protein